MRINRSKSARKTLKLYKLLFNIDTPFHIILDGTFVFTALKFKIDIIDRLKSLLQETYNAEVNLYIMKSSLAEVRDIGSKGAAALSFIRDTCKEINDEDIEGGSISEKTVNFLKTNESKSRKYCVATQDRAMRLAIGNKVAGIPLIYLNKVIMVLEPLGNASKRISDQNENMKSVLTESESTAVNSLEAVHGSVVENHEPVVVDEHARRKRKATCPNPLSTKQAVEGSHNSMKKQKRKYRSSH